MTKNEPINPNDDPEMAAEAAEAYAAQSTLTCEHGHLLWQPCGGCNVLAWTPPPGVGGVPLGA